VNGIFVTGTNTGVGKTIISAAIGLALKEKGLNVCYYKPFESGVGYKDYETEPSDTEFVSNLLNLPGEPTLYNTYTFKHPLAPGVAADLEDIDVDFDKVKKHFSELTNQFDYMIIEGAGGLLVPLSRFRLGEDVKCQNEGIKLVSDLAIEFALPTLIVSSPVLGTINHTLLSIEHCKTKMINIAGVIMNDNEDFGKLTSDTNEAVFRYYIGKDFLGRFPRLPKELCNGKKTLLEAVRENLDIEALV
jgi:dethiobiotin synthetase